MTSVTISFIASDGQVVLNGSKHFGAPAELAKSGDFRRREPCAWVAAQEYLANGTEAGVITISAA